MKDKKEQRQNWIAGMSPTTVGMFIAAAANLAGLWYAMEDNVEDNTKAIEKLEKSMDVKHSVLWKRINEIRR